MAPEEEKWKEQLPWFLTLYIPTLFKQKSTGHPRENEHTEAVKEWPVLEEERETTKEDCIRAS